MKLVRLTWLELKPETKRWSTTGFTIGDVSVRFGPVLENNGKPWTEGLTQRQFVAEVPLSNFPLSEERAVKIPDEERLKAEATLEDVADALSVASGSRRSLLSPAGFSISFLSENHEELQWLESHSELSDSGLGVSRVRWSPEFDSDNFGAFDGREDGVTLLSEAVGLDHDPSRFRELIRFFERAFAASSDRLVPPLAAFLGSRPAFAYSKSEVKRWIVRLRGPIAHADRKKALLREREIEWVTDRMLFAAYDVLLNKASWNASDTERRDVWQPLYGPLDATTVVAGGGVKWTATSEFRDQFGSYRVSMSLPSFTLPAPFWPRQRHHMEWRDNLKVINREEIEEVSKSDS
jgi:hypothetical protein